MAKQASSTTLEGLDVPVFKDPDAPMYIVEGDAGNDVMLRVDEYKAGPVTAFRGVNSGYGLLTVHNKTHVSFLHSQAGRGPKTCFHDDGVVLELTKGPNLVPLWVALAVIAAVIIGVGAVMSACRWMRGRTVPKDGKEDTNILRS
jgi:hypothetical protein